MRRLASALLASILATTVVAAGAPEAQAAAASSCVRTSATISVPLTTAKHSAAIVHASDAIAHGYPRVLVWHPDGAEKRRAALLKTIPTKAGHDRDEYPPAAGRAVIRADVRHIPSSQNRSAGAILGNTLRRYCAGTRFTYAGVQTPKPTPTTKPTPAPSAGTTPKPAPTPTPTTAPVSTPTAPASSDPRPGQCYVNGYYRKDGTYVHGYWRRCP